ncbi:MAG: hypothetical protein PHQ43_08860 [Dehalococcoidales bacterium]|nr:hypothetical protein [Dehalococcoidales bacterium]
MKREKAIFSPVRCLIHIPVGLIAGWCLLYALGLGVCILVYFALYEISEDIRIRDCAYIDIIGCLFGLCAVALIDMAWRVP